MRTNLRHGRGSMRGHRRLGIERLEPRMLLATVAFQWTAEVDGGVPFGPLPQAAEAECAVPNAGDMPVCWSPGFSVFPRHAKAVYSNGTNLAAGGI